MKRFLLRVLGVILILLAVGIGIYFGVYKCFIKSIIEIINAAKAGFQVIPIVWGVVKIIVGVPVAWYMVTVGVVAGHELINYSDGFTNQ